jgi:hypothetical protein
MPRQILITTGSCNFWLASNNILSVILRNCRSFVMKMPQLRNEKYSGEERGPGSR